MPPPTMPPPTMPPAGGTPCDLRPSKSRQTALARVAGGPETTADQAREVEGVAAGAPAVMVRTRRPPGSRQAPVRSAPDREEPTHRPHVRRAHNRTHGLLRGASSPAAAHWAGRRPCTGATSQQRRSCARFSHRRPVSGGPAALAAPLQSVPSVMRLCAERDERARRSPRCSPVADPAFQVTSVNDPEHGDDPILVQDVIHHAVIPDERILGGVQAVSPGASQR